ncbi:MAG: MltA domain-containing protein [Hyphomonadaceae bacterium]|nr:MltA domain-containing protein [Hyphomonadaceae bacterium]
MASGVAIRRIATAVLGATAVAVGVSIAVEASSLVKLDGSWKARIVKAKEARAKPARGSLYQPVAFADLPGWAQDDHLAAFKAFLKSCERVTANAREKAAADKGPAPSSALVAACSEASRVAGQIKSSDGARAFFEKNFTPSAVVHNGKPGLLTGYYEPVLKGSRTPQGPYRTPIYKRPPDLVTVIPETHRGAVKAGTLTHVRKTEKGNEPYFTRAQIDQGALKGKGLELLYFADTVDVFFMQIQGSGRVQLTDGTSIRVHYDGKNGHPYSSIGRYLIDKAMLAADKVSLDALAIWLKADLERAKAVMWHNASYVFFRELKGDEAGAPLGALNVPLTPGRSLALDPSHHPLGLPVYVSAPTMKHVHKTAPFNRLMVGQDVGSAIKGPERGDIYFGSGEAAGKLAGVTKHAGRFFVLVPKDAAARTEAAPDNAAAQKTKQ